MYPFRNNCRMSQRVNYPVREEQEEKDCGEKPKSVNVVCAASRNQAFREEVFTGNNLQMTLMSIPVCGDIGLEVHNDTDQFIRVEEGQGNYVMGYCEGNLEFQGQICKGDAVFVPAGIWHNICNEGRCPLKLSTIYAPPVHPRGTLHQTKEDAMRAEGNC